MTTWDSPRGGGLRLAPRGRPSCDAARFAAAGGAAAGERHSPALERAARELLALQASDWAFQVTRDLAGDYPARRVAAHADGAGRGARWLCRLRARRRTRGAQSGSRPRSLPTALALNMADKRVLILSWEYPPLIEGGLARHVRKLAENLVRAGRRGARAHPRARRLRRGGGRGRDRPPRAPSPTRPRDLDEFVAWVEHMNADMLAAGVELGDRYDFDVVHGHDWLVASRRRPPGAPLPLPAGRDDPRHGVRPPPGLGRQAPAVAHPRRRAVDGQPRRPRHHLLALHARARLRHLRARRGAGDGDPERDRPGRPRAGRRPGARCARRFAEPDEQLVLLVGRLVYEKGFQLALEALPGLIERARQRALPGRRLGHRRAGAARAGDRARARRPRHVPRLDRRRRAALALPDRRPDGGPLDLRAVRARGARGDGVRAARASWPTPAACARSCRATRRRPALPLARPGVARARWPSGC